MNWRAFANPAFLLALCVMAVSAIGMGTAIRMHGYRLEKLPIYPEGGRQLSMLPPETRNWIRQGTDRVESAEIVQVLGTENYVSRIYRRREADESDRRVQLDFHAAYYTGRIDTVPHVPERCFVGGGMQRSDQMRTLPIPMRTDNWLADPSAPERYAGSAGRIYTVRLDDSPFSDSPGRRVRLPRGVTPDRTLRMRISEFELDGGRRLYAGYFFIANGGTVSSATGVRTLAFDLTSDYAYYLKVQVTSGDVDSMEDLAEQAGDLLSDLIGEIMRCVPDWIEVELGNYPEDNPRRNEDGA